MKYNDEIEDDENEEIEDSEIGYFPEHNNDGHLQISKEGWVVCKITGKPIRYPIVSWTDLDYCPRCGKRLIWNNVDNLIKIMQRK